MKHDFGRITTYDDKFFISRQIDENDNIIDNVDIEGTVYNRSLTPKEFKKIVYNGIYEYAKMFNFKITDIKRIISSYWKEVKRVKDNNKKYEKGEIKQKIIMPWDTNYSVYNKDRTMLFLFSEKLFYTSVSGRRFFEEDR